MIAPGKTIGKVPLLNHAEKNTWAGAKDWNQALFFADNHQKMQSKGIGL
ncbi:MAG: hypothetical protein LUQ56_03210 [Methylococcaceae bacterium]|nr:hypothetical protein [Methylococcaceae bacterium]MDD1637129.1 hypothetical protein [Methylococcaceae bacterium]MDD1643747.1 hypothetical protein [Methylococcaceae bacterium]